MTLSQFENVQNFLSESPPLADLFAECEWRDWINQDYPNKRSQSELSEELLLSNEDYFP